MIPFLVPIIEAAIGTAVPMTLEAVFESRKADHALRDQVITTTGEAITSLGPVVIDRAFPVSPSEAEQTVGELRKRLSDARHLNAKYSEYCGKAAHARQKALASSPGKAADGYRAKQSHYEAKRAGYKSALEATYRDIDRCVRTLQGEPCMDHPQIPTQTSVSSALDGHTVPAG